MRRSTVVACLLAVVLGGCGGGDNTANPTTTIEPRNTASSPSPKTSTKSEACTLLTAKDRRSIAGGPVDVLAPLPVSNETQQCRWVRSLTGATPTIQVLTMPAQTWAKSVPMQIDQAILSGRVGGKALKKLQAAKKEIARGTDEMSDADACGLFELLAGVNGRKGAAETIAFPPIGNQRSATARTCTKGVFTSLIYSEPELAPSPALGQATVRLMRLAHKRAIKTL